MLSPASAVKFIGSIRNWPVAFFQTYFHREGLITFNLRNGFSLIIRSDTSDSILFKKIWLDRVFDPRAFGFDFDWKNARTVLDVGAHSGLFMLYAASKAPSARIISVEPDPSNFSLLKRHVELNGLTNRVASENRKIGLLSGIGISLSFIFESYSVSRIDLLKLNCGGAEYESLYFLPPEYFRQILCIAVNCHHVSLDPKNTCESLERFLTEKGYEVRRKGSNLMAFKK